MPSYDSTARVPFASGGRVGSKKPKIKRIILWKGKAKDWPGAKKAAERTKKAKGGSVKKDYKLGTKFQGDYKGKTVPGKIKEFVKTGAKQTAGTAKKIVQKIKKHKKKSWTNPKYLKKKTDDLGEVRPPNKWIQKRTDKAKGGEVGLDDYKKSRLSKWVKKYGAKGLRPQAKAEGGKADKNWIQGVNKSIKKRGTKGVCTGKKFGSASCKPGSKRYNLAKTFKKMARARHASGGLVRFI